MNSRKGLRRSTTLSISYIVEGPNRTMMIDRQAYPRRFFVRDAGMPKIAGFFCMEFRRLGPARAYAEIEAGILPYFLKRSA